MELYRHPVFGLVTRGEDLYFTAEIDAGREARKAALEGEDPFMAAAKIADAYIAATRELDNGTSEADLTISRETIIDNALYAVEQLMEDAEVTA